jgi:hypothetical protein
MSLSNARYQAERWWLTAQEDWEVARALREAGKYSQAYIGFSATIHASKSSKLAGGRIFSGRKPKVNERILIQEKIKNIQAAE